MNSRYYNPNFGRFVNADGTIGANDDVISHNLFAYCSNNPIKYDDILGESIFGAIIVGGLVGFAVGVLGQTISDVTTSIMKGKPYVSPWQNYAGSGIGGIVGVGTLGTGPVISSSLSNGASTLTTETLNVITGKQKLEPKKSLKEVTVSMGIGAVMGKVELKIDGITSGRNSNSSIFKSGLTKTQRYSYNMSNRVMLKGVSANVIDNIFSSEISGIQTYVFDSISYYENSCPVP